MTTPYLQEMNPTTGQLHILSPSKGCELATLYQTSVPFPHIAIDNFLPEEVITRVKQEFPPYEELLDSMDNRNQEYRKRNINPERLSEWTRNLFYTFNSKQFITLIENISGIQGLIPDPYFLGGGLHELFQGGYLSIHADFNRHKRMNLERRINVLIYLNDNWKESYGGQLELWDERMMGKVKSYVPYNNRCVIFSTTETTYHGNPNPVQHPKNMPRRSIALYYFTATWDGSKRENTTDFKQRPGSGDKFDWKLKTITWATDLLPPVVYRKVRKWL